MTAPFRHASNFRSHRRQPGRLAVARARQEHGQALVEFVLLLPILLLLVFGIVQFGMALNSANDETHLANEVARYAAVNENPSPEALQKWAKSQADSGALAEQLVCISFPNGTSNIGDPVEVKVTGTMNWLPILKLEAASTVVEGKADMRLEAAPTNYTAGCA